MPIIALRYKPPSHGWLALTVAAADQTVVIDASDVPNNPVQDLVVAIEAAATGAESSVWWHLEPDGYFTTFKAQGQEIHFSIDFAARSDRRLTKPVLSVSGTKAEILLPFWRLLREFESRSYEDPNWPSVDFSRMQAIRSRIDAAE